jgi:hypothetical protein
MTGNACKTVIKQRRCRLCALFLALGLSSSAAAEVITSGALQQAGVFHIGDVLLLANPLRVSSTDGYTWRINPGGLSPFQRQGWTVMLDGQRVDLNTFDQVHFNLPPVSVDWVDSVEILDRPRLSDGEFADGGLIHIHTRKPRRGLSIRGHAATGSETKDPGPYRYTTFATPNVDRTGTDAAATLDFAARQWYIRAGLIKQTHAFTDLAMVRRNQRIFAAPGFMELDGTLASLKVSLDAASGSHTALANYSRADRYFFFFQPLGREIPLDCAIGHVGANGDFAASERLRFRYRLQYSQQRFDPLPNALDFDFDWRLQNFHVNFEGDFLSQRIGVGFDRFRLNRLGAFDIGKVYASVRHNHQETDVLIAFSGGEMGIKAALANRWTPTPRQALQATLSFAQRLFAEDNNLWYWSERGYDLLEANGMDYTVTGRIGNRRQLTTDFAWKYMFNPGASLEIAAGHRLFADLYLERQDFTFHPDDCAFSAPTTLHADQGGQVFDGRVAFQQTLSTHLTHQFFYGYQAAIAGDGVFKDVWASIPQHKINYSLTYTPVENFSIWAMVTQLSASRWADYRGVDGAVCESGSVTVRYTSTVKPATILDLQFQKWFWRRRLQANLLFRNVLDSNYRYHPIGATFDLGVYIQVKAVSS